jgi:hypothetical protein
LTAGDPTITPLAKMYEAYFATLEKQAVPFETVASKLEDTNVATVGLGVSGR